MVDIEKRNLKDENDQYSIKIDLFFQILAFDEVKKRYKVKTHTYTYIYYDNMSISTTVQNNNKKKEKQRIFGSSMQWD